MKARIWAIGLGLLGGCANPCEDDGLIQSGQGDCPADASGNASDSETETDASSASASDTATASDSANSASASDSASASESDSDSASASDSDSASDTESASASDTDSASASDTDSGGGTTPYCVDADDDGFGDPASCVDVPDGEDPPDGSVPNAEDCDDGDAQTFPGAAELDSETACMQDEDEDGWGDDAPADGVTPGSDCSDDGVDPCAVLITQDGTDDNPYDQNLIAALQMDGYEVLNFADTDVVLEDGNGVDVVIISETSLSTEIAGTMQDTLAPVVCLEGLIWDDMGMAPEANVTSNDDILILDDGNALAAGLTGSHTAVAGIGAGLFYVAAPTGAEIVVSVDGNPADIVEFAYDGGATMLDGFVAPARRVGLGYDADQGANPTSTIEPSGIALFRAAVTWATGG